MSPRRFAAKNSSKSVKKSKAPARAAGRSKAAAKGKQDDLFEAPARKSTGKSEGDHRGPFMR